MLKFVLKKLFYFVITAMCVFVLMATPVSAATCKNIYCTRKATSGGNGYCYLHNPNKNSPKKSSSSKSYSNSGSKSASKYGNKSGSKSGSKSSNNSKKAGSKSSNSSSKSKSYYEMPDCDDYENYDDFMDDWDGNMPNGQDAEDYWEDW